jgi:putative serine protease PepD
LPSKTVVILAASAFVFGVGGVAVGATVFTPGSSTPEFDTTPPGTAANAASQAALTEAPASDATIAAKVLPSVVSVNVTGDGESDTGSGVILTANGYILTNNHVVAAATSGGTVSVTFSSSSTARAKIVGTDPLDDLAVIKVARTGLAPASLGNSAALQVGDPVLAFGAPLGLSGTVTSGIVSALNRPVQTESEQQPQQTLTDPFGPGLGNLFGLGGSSGSGSSSSSSSQSTVIEAIQTDAAINPGNSGGPLVDTQGQVIGIDSAIATLGSDDTGTQSGNIGVGFAIPVNEAKTIAHELITTGHAQHPLLGVSLEDRTSSGQDQAVVQAVTPGGAAAEAGMKTGDVITAIGPVQTQGTDAVIAAVRSYAPGQSVTVTVRRGSKTLTLHATLSNAAWTQT